MTLDSTVIFFNVLLTQFQTFDITCLLPLTVNKLSMLKSPFFHQPALCIYSRS